MSDTNNGRTHFDAQRERDIRDARDRVVGAAEVCERMESDMERRFSPFQFESAKRVLLNAVRALRAARGSDAD
jgi:hypothetical protein